MRRYIAIDSGTTNTRVALIENGVVQDISKHTVGVGSTRANGEQLSSAIKCAIADMLQKHHLQPADIEQVLVSGMLTSELGLFPVAHIAAPAGVPELHTAMRRTTLRDICETPFTFIPGVKWEKVGQLIDMMRGEETELAGILSMGYTGDLFVLPGSHSKIITVRHNKIDTFYTMLTGEMIAALSQHTILKHAVDLSMADTDQRFLMMGYRQCEQMGINHALFSVRVLQTNGCTDVERYSYLLGVALCQEIQQIVKMRPSGIVIGGKEQIKQAMAQILACVTDANVVCITKEETDTATFLGQVKIFEFKFD